MQAKVKGFSLIEVMVSLVILVIGLIGIFNLHIVAKRGSFESFQQTQASYYANDIINRMRLNISEFASYSGTYKGDLEPTKACDVAVGANSICTTAETRAWDLYQWERSFQGDNETSNEVGVGGLDTATACISVSGSDVTVVITWRGIRETSDGAAGRSQAIKNCGASGNRRRAYEINTVIM